MAELIDIPDAADDWEPAAATGPDRRNPAAQVSMFQAVSWPPRPLALLAVDLDAVARRLRLTVERSWDGRGPVRAAVFVLDDADFVVSHHEGDPPGTHVWIRKGGLVDRAERLGRLLAALGVGPEAVRLDGWAFALGEPAAWTADRARRVMSQQTFWELFRTRPGMYLGSVSFDRVTAFLQGYYTAHGSAPLDALQPWLADRLGFGRNLIWSALVAHCAFPGGVPARPWSKEDDQRAVDVLFGLLDEFFDHGWVPEATEGTAGTAETAD